MALIDKASLLMVPSTYEAGKLYNVLPSGNRAPDNKGGAGYDQTRADFDFDRGSNAAATRIGSDGLIKKYRENLLTESNNFSDSDWSSLNSPTLTSGQADKDGGTNAWKFSATSSGSDRAIYQNTTGLNIVVTSSFYAKKGSVDFIYLASTRASSSQAQWFDLASGTLGTKLGSDIIASNIESVGNGWYRCSVTSAPYTAGYSFIALVDGDNSQTSSNGDFVYIQNAQLESGLVSTDYLDSTSVTGKAGVLVDLPRINYDANGENGSLLLEPSRQQLIQYSEYYNTYWNQTSISVTNNATTSPEGLQNASKLVPDNGTGGNRSISKTFLSLTGLHTFSVYAKAGEYGYISLRLRNSPSAWAMFDLTNGLVHAANTNAQMVSDSPKIEPVGIDGWYRCSVVLDPSGSAVSGQLSVSYSAGITGDETNNFSGDGSSGIYVYGAMLETATGGASYPSSYIPNNGESGGVTRAADSCSVTGASDILNDSEGVLFVEMSALANDQTSRRLSISDGTNNNRVMIGYSTGSNALQFVLSDGGAVVVNSAYTLSDITETAKIAFKYKVNDCEIYVNGSRVILDTTATMPSGLDVLGFYQGSTNENLFANVKQVAVFNEALSDSELATLTTL